MASLYCPQHTAALRAQCEARSWPPAGSANAYAYLIIGLLNGDEERSCDSCGTALGEYDSAGLLVFPPLPHLDEQHENYYFSSIRGLELFGPVPELRKLQLRRQLEVQR